MEGFQSKMLIRTIKQHKYGSPKSLVIESIPTPTPQEDEVLIQVHNASVNPLEWRKVRGTPILVRFADGLFKPKNWRLGRDVSGKIVAVGAKVKDLVVGDEVFGLGNGTLAEFACAKAHLVVKKPESISFEMAAATPLAGVTAYQALKVGRIGPNMKVLINGASGGVGHMAVQIAVAAGAEVTAVCSSSNASFVKNLGAKTIIDYRQQDYTQNKDQVVQYDIILDIISNHSIRANLRVLAPMGKYVIVGFKSLFRLMMIKLKSSADNSSVILHLSHIKSREDLDYLCKLMQTGKLTPSIDRVYPLSEVPQALLYLESKRAKGKVVIQVIKASMEQTKQQA
jgi:NADPH:quinone reductase-like Zn-dependent oxidoreductase